MSFNVTWHERLPSTNSFLKQALQDKRGVRPGTVVAAREQTAGRGRAGRSWASGRDANLAFSFLEARPGDPGRLPSLSLAVALGVQDALGTYGIPTRLKWPNDLLAARGKICGILAEAMPGGVICGVGVNINMTAEEAAAIDQPASSMLIESGTARPPPEVLDRILRHLAPWLETWRRAGFPGFREVWNARYDNVGGPVMVRDGDGRKRGILAGFGESGELLLQEEATGPIRAVYSGDIVSS